MRHLLRLISLRYMSATPGRTILTTFGILLGVSVVFAIDVVNGSVIGSFKSTMDTVTGKTALTVGSPTGVAEELLDSVRAVPGVAMAVPVIEESAHDDKHDTQLVVLGVDTLADDNVRDYEVTANDVKLEDDIAFLNDPHSVIVTTHYAAHHGIKNGDTLSLDTVSGKHDYTVRGTLSARGATKVFGGDMLLMDVFAAQIAFGRGKRFDHIDIVPDASVDVPTLQRRLEGVLGGKANVTRPERRTEETEHLIAGFKLGLSLASLVAMFVGGFIVYNALAIAVAQRRHEIGVLRALGTTRRQILILFVGEGLLLGVIGGVLGIGFGLLLARVALKIVAGTISLLYANVDPDHLLITTHDIVVALSLGVAIAMIAAFFPARSAAFVDPASVMRRKTGGGGVALSSSSASLKAGGAALLLAAVIAGLAHIRQDFALGFAVSVIGAFATAFIAPSLALWLGTAARRAFGRSNPSFLLGSVGFVRNAGRNSIAIAALGMSLANAINVDAFVTSMKHNTSTWVDRSARADLVVFSGTDVKASADHPLPEAIAQELSNMPEVAFVDAERSFRDTLRDKPFNLGSLELDGYLKYNEMPVVSGDLATATPAIKNGTGLAASQTFTNTFHMQLGDRVTLQTPAGPRTFEIVVVYADFGSELGALLTTRAVYRKIWRDTLVDTFGIYVRPGADIAKVRDRILDSVGKRYRLLAMSNGQYKEELMHVIDGSFTLARSTELVAIIVAILGIINTLLVTVMDRRTEIAVLKAIGAANRQIQRMLITEGALIGLAATVVGIVFGSLFSAYVVKELVRFQVGWQMTWKVSGWLLLETAVVAQVVTLLSVWWPLRSANRIDTVEALQSE